MVMVVLCNSCGDLVTVIASMLTVIYGGGGCDDDFRDNGLLFVELL